MHPLPPRAGSPRTGAGREPVWGERVLPSGHCTHLLCCSWGWPVLTPPLSSPPLWEHGHVQGSQSSYGGHASGHTSPRTLWDTLSPLLCESSFQGPPFGLAPPQRPRGRFSDAVSVHRGVGSRREPRTCPRGCVSLGCRGDRDTETFPARSPRRRSPRPRGLRGGSTTKGTAKTRAPHATREEQSRPALRSKAPGLL